MSSLKRQSKLFDVSRVRQDFPILSRSVYGKPLVYLDNAATSQKPRSVINSLTDYYEGYNSNVHRGIHSLSMEATDKYEEARSKIATFINAESSESMIWTRNSTEAFNIVAYSWAKQNLGCGDEIVTTEMEHHSNLVPWQRVAASNGAVLKFISMNPNGTLDLSNLDDVINQKTKFVSVVHMSNSMGTINPIKQIFSKAKSVGAVTMLDGAQSVPHLPVDVQDLNCDFLAFSGHKMLGPTGIGALYAKLEILEEMDPFLTGGEMVLEVSLKEATWNHLPMRFEAGTPNIADAIALGSAVDYLSDLGMDKIRQHEIQLLKYSLERFKEIEEIDVYGPSDVSIRGGVVSFHANEVHPHDLGTFLDRDGVAIRTGHHCTMPVMTKLGLIATARASFYLYNTEQEVDTLVDSLKNSLKYFAHGNK